MQKLSLTALVATAALAAPAAASAHVTLQPQTAPAGGFTRLDVRVPNERDDAGTTKVTVRFPAGFEHASYEPVAGWDAKITRKGENVGTITWSAASAKDAIAPGQFRDFGLSVGVPEGKPGDKLAFKALQTYEGGEVVRWIGPADGDEPAPQVTLTAASGEDAAHEEEAAAPAPVSGSASSTGGDDGDDTLAIVALGLGALGLLAGAAGLMVARRTPGRVAAR